MALEGTIDTFELTEVVRLLAAGKKTGVLRLEGSRGSGRLWVNGGRITAIEVDHAPSAAGHAEAMFELLRFDDGHFSFVSGEQADPDGEPTDVEAILVEAEAQLAEWREIERVVPTTRAHLTLCPELVRSDVVLDKSRWRVVAGIGGGITVVTLGEALGLGELPVSRAVKDLIELGIVELEVPASSDPAPVEPAGDEAVSVLIEAEPVLDPPIGGPTSARAQLDEFAAGFGLTESPGVNDAIVEVPSVEAADVGDEGDFAASVGNGNGNGVDEPNLDETSGLDDISGLDETSGLDDISGLDPLSDFTGGFGAVDGADEYEDPPSPFLGAGNDAAEVARQLSNLSPAAARAVAAAAKATTDEEREAALAVVAQEGDEPIDRELLLRFLASVRA